MATALCIFCMVCCAINIIRSSNKDTGKATLHAAEAVAYAMLALCVLKWLL